MKTRSIEDLVRHIDQGGMVALRGFQELAMARDVLQHVVRVVGYGLVFEPESKADLIDYLTVPGGTGLDGAVTGAGIGAGIGLLVGRPGHFATLGFVLGLLAGVAQGIDRVERGWRVRAIRDADGSPLVTIQLPEPARP